MLLSTASYLGYEQFLNYLFQSGVWKPGRGFSPKFKGTVPQLLKQGIQIPSKTRIVNLQKGRL